MISFYCWKYRKNTESKNPKFVKTKKGRIIFLSKCAACESRKTKFIKEQEASGFLSSFGIKMSLSKIPLECHLSFIGISKLIQGIK